MDTNTNVILHSETMDKREVHNKSPNMEQEAANRGLAHLKGKVNIVEITTDASTSVTKMLGLFPTCVNFLFIFISIQLIITLRLIIQWMFGTSQSY